MLLLAQNLPMELQVCPHPQPHRVGVFWGLNPGGLAASQVKILLWSQEIWLQFQSQLLVTTSGHNSSHKIPVTVLVVGIFT